MPTKNAVGLLLFSLILFTLWSPARALGQTGFVSGEVRLCSKDGEVPSGEEAKDVYKNVDITAVRTDSPRYNNFTFGQCNPGNKNCTSCEDLEEDCKHESPAPDGIFTFSGLNLGLWTFRPSITGYSVKVIPKGIRIHYGDNKVIPPQPIWLKARPSLSCPGEPKKRSAIEGRQPDSASSALGSGGDSPYIILVLYKDESAKDSAPRQEEKPITLKGRVVDTGGEGLANASVFVTDLNETADRSSMLWNTATKDEGKFTLDITADLREGAYLFSVKLNGFRTLVMDLNEAVEMLERNGTVALSREDELSEDETPLIEKLEATRRHVFLPEVMQTLPLPGTRSFDRFALLAPGVLPPPETFGGVGPGVSPGVGTAGQFSVNGQRSRENNFTIDGSDNNDEDIGTRRQGFIITVPQPVESVQELQVITALGDAQFGRNIGGQINALTKTGGAGRAHGSLYMYVTDHRLKAPDPFDQTAAGAPPSFTPRRSSDGEPVLLDGAPLVRQSQVGGEDQFTHLQLGLAMGGQLTRDNDTSYFVSAERQDVRANKEVHFAVPTVRQRGAFSSGDTGLLLGGGPAGPRPLYPASVPGNAIFSLFPFPNNPLGPYGENTYSTVLPADGHGMRLSIKVGRDFRGDPPGGKWWKAIFTRRAHITQVSGRYNFTDELSTLPVTGGALFSSLRPKVRTQNLTGFINRSLSDSTSDTLRLSFGRTRLSFGERRDASMLPSSALPGTQFLLNAPLLLNVTKPNPDGTLNEPSFFSAAGNLGSPLLTSLGYVGVTQTEQITGPLGQVFIAGFSPVGVDVENFPQTRDNNTVQLADTITSVKDSHIFTFGVDVRHTSIDSTLDRNFRPRAVFNGLQGIPVAAAIEQPGVVILQPGMVAGATLAAAGLPTGLFQTLATAPDSAQGFRYTQINLFFQDQWRLRQGLHLTAGLRYEMNTVPDTVGGLRDIRELAEEAARICDPQPRCRDLIGALTAASPANLKSSFFNADINDFDVRVGFAWMPSKLRDTSIRGGFATYSGQFPTLVINQTRNAFPNFLPLNLANFTPRSGNQTFLFNHASPAVQQLLPSSRRVKSGTLNQLASNNPIVFLINHIFSLQALGLSPTALGLDLVLPQPELQPPYAYHYGLTVEHQFRDDYLMSAAYVGTRGLRLLRVVTPGLGLNNSRFANTVGLSPLTDAEPFPFFRGQMLPPQANLVSQSFAIAPTFFNSSSQSTYNSLQIEFRKRYSNGFLVGSALTYSHSIDDASDFFDSAGAFALPQNSARSSERASSNFDVRLRSATHFVLDLQREWVGNRNWDGTRKEWLRRILGGLQLAGIFTAQGGQPYTVNSALDINRDGNLTDRLNTTAGIVRDPAGGRVQLRLAPGVSTRALLAPDGLDGSVGRNTFRAPHLYTIDFSVTGTVPFRNRHRFVVRVEFFNLFNWSNYGIPVRILESPAFGTSINTLTPPRTIQLVGKFQF